MGRKAGTPIVDIPVDRVFIGSCTNSRLDDSRAAAHLVAGKHVAKNIKQALIVPGSRGIKSQAEKEGLDKVFTAAGFEWRDAVKTLSRPSFSACDKVFTAAGFEWRDAGCS